MNEKKLSRPLISLIVSIALIIVGIAGSFILQTNSGKTTIRNVTIESESGHTLAMDVYIPENATAETPAPAIFVQHGGNNNKEEMQHYCIELARRGYVAIGVDMYGMGESEPLPDSEWLTQGRGLYDAVRYGVTLPYVDTDRVSLLGYSRGGKAAGEALQCDNDSLNVVKAIFLIHSDPIVRNSEGYTDVYGARDVAVLADKNDEFFFSEKANDNGTYSNDANKYAANLSSPAEYVINNSAQSFLYFGIDPATTSEQRVAETVYEQDYGGKTGSRQIFVSNETHMAGWWSPLVMNRVLTFFNRVMPTGTALSASSYTYTIWNIFKIIALSGLLFALAMALSFIEGTLVIPGLLPGMKLGLANIVVMYALFFMGPRQALVLDVLKALFVFLVSGFTAGFLSLCGGLLSLAVMWVLYYLLPVRPTWFILSVCGALAHNVGQLLGAGVIISSSLSLYYAPVMLVLGLVMGALTSVTLRALLPALGKMGFNTHENRPE